MSDSYIPENEEGRLEPHIHIHHGGVTYTSARSHSHKYLERGSKINTNVVVAAYDELLSGITLVRYKTIADWVWARYKEELENEKRSAPGTTTVKENATNIPDGDNYPRLVIQSDETTYETSPRHKKILVTRGTVSPRELTAAHTEAVRGKANARYNKIVEWLEKTYPQLKEKK